jgi:DNA primase
LRRFVPRVVLVFDADEGGDLGVDRALELFVSQSVELSIATLPAGLDPCDLLITQGAEPFLEALNKAADALDFKLNQMIKREAHSGVEGQLRLIDAVLGVIARAPEASDAAMQLKLERMITRISQRLGVREATVWARLKELRASLREGPARPPEAIDQAPRSAPAPAHERELAQLLLAEPTLVAAAMADIPCHEITHPGIQELVKGLYKLQEEGDTPDFDALRAQLENPALVRAAIDLMEIGRSKTEDRRVWLKKIVGAFRALQSQGLKQQLKSQLTAVSDHETGVELLRRLQNQTVGSGS